MIGIGIERDLLMPTVTVIDIAIGHAHRSPRSTIVAAAIAVIEIAPANGFARATEVRDEIEIVGIGIVTGGLGPGIAISVIGDRDPETVTVIVGAKANHRDDFNFTINRKVIKLDRYVSKQNALLELSSEISNLD